MKIPILSVEIINSNKDDALNVLQGISRYIEAIYVRKTLIENEGSEILNFFKSRYPTKKIIVNIVEFQFINNFIKEIVEKTEIKEFIVKGDFKDIKFQNLCKYLEKNQRKLIIHCDSINIPTSKYKLFFYFKPESKDNSSNWSNEDLLNLKKLSLEKKYIIVGNIVKTNITFFNDQWIDEFIVSEEVCYSFNSVETCKLIYLKIKENFCNNV